MIKRVFLGALVTLFAVVVIFLCAQIYSQSKILRALDDVPPAYAYGPADADLSMVEFVKYTCPHCRDIHGTVLEAVQRDGHVRYVPRVLPTSGLADAQMAYAAARQDAFKLAHESLLQDPRIMDEGGLMAIAGTLGLDTEKLQADMEDDAVIAEINENVHLFHAVGGRATPTFLIGNDILYVPEGRMPTVEDFLKMFEEARQ